MGAVRGMEQVVQGLGADRIVIQLTSTGVATFQVQFHLQRLSIGQSISQPSGEHPFGDVKIVAEQSKPPRLFNPPIHVPKL